MPAAVVSESAAAVERAGSPTSTSRAVAMATGGSPSANPCSPRPAMIQPRPRGSAARTPPATTTLRTTSTTARRCGPSPSRPTTGVATAPTSSVMVRVHWAEEGLAPVSAAIAGTSGAPRLLMTATHVPMKISAGTSALGAGEATSCQANPVEQNGLVVITGAAGALGHAVVAEFRAAGREVVALDRAGERLEQLGREPGVHGVAADLADRDSVVAAWQRIDEIGVPAALVALAGGFRPSSLADLTEELWAQMWGSNVTSLLWSAQQAASRMAAAVGGAIVTVGSRTAVSGKAPIAHAVSKAAVVRATELLAEELRPAGIRVNCILPSVIDTPANREWMPPELAARAVAPAAIARVIAFLAGPDSAPTSGARVPVYGDA